ncbi:MAG: rRNA maturation RNase YbeY [Bacteroidota bacterium]
MAIHVNNLQDKVELPSGTEELLRDLARASLTHTGLVEAEVGISLADDDYLRILNRDFRGIDQATDVLSFALQEKAGDEPDYAEEGPAVLGDVFISMDRAVSQAREFGHSIQREIAYLSVHGLLHLMGYDHDGPEAEGEMRAAEEEILRTRGIKRE